MKKSHNSSSLNNIFVHILAFVMRGNPYHIPPSSERSYHEFGVTFRQHISDKVDFFQLFYNLMQKL